MQKMLENLQLNPQNETLLQLTRETLQYLEVCYSAMPHRLMRCLIQVDVPVAGSDQHTQCGVMP